MRAEAAAPSSPASDASNALRPAIGLTSATALVAGIIIGASVFVQPSEITTQVGSLWGIVLVANVVGTFIFAWVLADTSLLEETQRAHLKELADDGVIRRIDHQKVPPHVEYELTDFGKSLASLLAPLCEWGTHHNDQVATIVKNREHPAKIV